MNCDVEFVVAFVDYAEVDAVEPDFVPEADLVVVEHFELP